MVIKTNKIKCHIDKDALSKKYDFFKVSTSEDYFKSGASVLDSSLLENNVQSVLFERGKSFYIMMLADFSNKQRLKEIFEKSDNGSKLFFEKTAPDNVSDYQLIQLMLNGLGSGENQYLRFNNLTGHLYCFHPGWLIHGKQSSMDSIIKIPCLELKLSDDCLLHMTVHTLTSTLLRKKISFKKKKFEDYPKYVFAGKNTLRRKLNDDTEMCYIMRQTDNAKTEIPFLNFQSEEKFIQSKMGVLRCIKQAFNEKYSGICSLDFDTVSDVLCIQHCKKQDKEFERLVGTRLANQKLHIVDSIGDSYSFEFCNRIAKSFQEQYNLKASVGKRLTKDALNIKLIHNAEYYIDIDDPHNDRNEGYVVQHITFEDYSWDSAFALKSVVNELMIKQDLAEKKISLYDWKSSKLGSMSFGLCEKIDNIDRYFFIDINKDGTFSVSEQELDLFSMSDYDRLVKIFEDSKTKGENIKGLVKDADGNINAIKDSDWISIPEVDDIYQVLSSGNNKLRSKEKRDSLLAASLDIHCFNLSGESGLYYFVGDIGEGMRPAVQRAANIRKIEGLDKATNLFEQLLPLMDVTFVRNGQLTVVPFPFKYLREYIKIISKEA